MIASLKCLFYIVALAVPVTAVFLLAPRDPDVSLLFDRFANSVRPGEQESALLKRAPFRSEHLGEDEVNLVLAFLRENPDRGERLDGPLSKLPPGWRLQHLLDRGGTWRKWVHPTDPGRRVYVYCGHVGTGYYPVLIKLDVRLSA